MMASHWAGNKAAKMVGCWVASWADYLVWNLVERMADCWVASLVCYWVQRKDWVGQVKAIGAQR
jgi:hypothetical protein